MHARLFRPSPLILTLSLLAVPGLTGCPSELTGPTPTVERVEPQLICTEQLTTTMLVHGESLSPIVRDSLLDGRAPVLPAMTLQQQADPFGDPLASEPPALLLDDTPDTGIVTWQAQEQMTLELGPDLALAPGVYALTATNAQGADNTLDQAFTAVPPPTLTSVEPEYFCSEQVTTVLTLTGSGFVTLGGALPTVAIGDASLVPDAAEDCQALAGPAGGESCNRLVVTVLPETLPPGVYDVVVTNPPPAHCFSTETVQVEIVPPPDITDIVLNPICTEQFSQTVQVFGEGFITIDGSTLPEVTIDGSAFTVDAALGCTPLTVPDGVESCTELVVTIPLGGLAPGDHDVIVTNPAPAGCETGEAYVLTVVPPPELISVDPPTICDSGGEFDLTGTGFRPDATVLIGGVPTQSASYISSTSIRTTVLGLAPGLYDVTVQNTEGCEDTLAAAITVIPGPIVFFFDPWVIYNGVTIEGTIYVAGLGGAPLAVELRHQGTGQATALATFSWNPLTPGRIQARVDAGWPPGVYDVIVHDPLGCQVILSAGVTIVDNTQIAIEAVDPPFGWTDTNTGVAITAVNPAPPGSSQFLATPRAYLNPSTPGPGTVAMPLKSVAWVRADLLNAVIPKGLPPDSYDLIVVNPDGDVGVLPNAFEVVSNPPPTVITLQPGLLPTNADSVVVVQGDNFRNPYVTLTCLDPGGAVTTFDATVTGFTATSIDMLVRVASDGIPADNLCVVRVVNDDGTYVDFSALATSNPAENLANWNAGPNMNTARRAPVALAGRVTSAERFLYAIGGDDGAASGAFDSVEAVRVDRFGNLGTWSVLPYSLAAPRTLAAGVRVGRFLYLVGGNDGSAAVTTVSRAEVLDPLNAPEIRDISITTGNGTGLGGGIWYYRVSAVFDATDNRNPDGESLASDPLVMQLPDLPGKLQLTLLWNAVPDAISYRIYRSPLPDQTSGSEVLIGTAPAGPSPNYVDLGDVAIVPNEIPLPLGSTGVWRELTTAALNTSREGASLVLGAEPGASNDPDSLGQFYLYALGGRDASGTVLANWEYLSVEVLSATEHVVGSWQQPVGQDMPEARWQLGGYVMSAFSSSVVPFGETWIYAGTGLDAGVTPTSDYHAAAVLPGGNLGAWNLVSGGGARAGYGTIGINNRLFMFGGGPTVTAGNRSTSLCDGSAGAGCAGGEFAPGVHNWNQDTAMGLARYLMGSTLESAFLFVVGGDTGAGPTNTVELTIW